MEELADKFFMASKQLEELQMKLAELLNNDGEKQAQIWEYSKQIEEFHLERNSFTVKYEQKVTDHEELILKYQQLLNENYNLTKALKSSVGENSELKIKI
jgi:vacuolar-type H+-ATPase subunit I/STV1